MVNVYAIVVTYNGAKWIDKCFGSLVNSSIPINILAIDNCSSDGTPMLIRKKFPQVEVIETGQNLGFGRANNIGLKRVLDENGDYAFLLNQDAWVENDTIEKLAKIHKRNREYGILSPVEYYKPGYLDLRFKESYAPQKLLDDLQGLPDEVYQTEFVNAAAWLIPNEIIKSVGGFDPIYPHYGEDLDYSFRLKRENKKIGIVGNALYFHDRPQVPFDDCSPYRKIQYGRANKIIYMRWGKPSFFVRFIMIVLKFLKDIWIYKKKYRIQYIQDLKYFIKNWFVIIDKKNYYLTDKSF